MKDFYWGVGALLVFNYIGDVRLQHRPSPSHRSGSMVLVAQFYDSHIVTVGHSMIEVTTFFALPN